MSNIGTSLNEALNVSGCMGAALVDFESGMCLGTAGNPGFDLEFAAAGNADVVRANKKVRDALDLQSAIEDILISLDSQYHLIRMVGRNVFLYVVLERAKANLALARRELALIEKGLDIARG